MEVILELFGQLAELPARVPDPPALDPKLRGAAHGVVSVAPCAPCAPPAPPDLFHFAHFRCKKGVEIIFDLPKMTPKQPDVFC